MEDRFRKPQTAAGFEPKSRKTATAKTAETSLTKPTQKKKTSLEIWPWKTASESLKQHQDSSPSHAKPQPQKLPKRRIQNPLKRNRQEKIASSKENLSLEIWPWKTASESLKQQQDSSPSHAKPQPQKLPQRRLQNPLKRKRQEKIDSSKENLSLEIWPWKTASESLKQQQDSSPSHATPQPQKLPQRRLQNPLKRKRQEKIASSKENLSLDIWPASSKENLSLEIWPWKTASESLKQQQDSSPTHAKPQPQKLPQRRLQNPLKTKRQEKIASSKENLSLEIWPWKTASESLKQQQDPSPSHAKPRKDCLQQRKP